VLRDGNVIETRDMATVSQDELIRMMVGRELSNVFPKKDVAPGNIVLEVNQLRCRAAGIHDVSVSIRAGEIVGLAGLVGSGRTELARTIFGLTPADSGEIKVYGRAVEIRGPRDAVACGIAYVPEDRLRHGVVPQFPISANITLAILERLKRLGGIDFAEETRLATEYVRRLRIKTSSIWSAAGSLSGGNQQKVALARWLAIGPKILILDEPTQGVDIGAKAEIHGLIMDLAEQGVAILLISSEMPEVLGMSDRIAVMHTGAIAGVLSREHATQSRILSLALGHADMETTP
jgi:rhamnose transport system ATP-binding protein